MKLILLIFAFAVMTGTGHARTRVSIEWTQDRVQSHRGHDHRYQERCNYGQHRHHDCRNCNRGGVWEYRQVRYWVAPRHEQVWQPARVEWRYTPCDGWMQVQIGGGHYVTRTIPGYWDHRYERIWVARR